MPHRSTPRCAAPHGLGRWLRLLLLVSGLSLTSESASRAAEGPTPQPLQIDSQMLGITHAKGAYSLTDRDCLNEGADEILKLGSKTIKLWLNTPKKEYPFHSKWPKCKTFVELVKTDYYREVFSKPFTTIVLVAFNPQSSVDYWRKGMKEHNRYFEQLAFYELTKYLLTTYKGTGKTFVLQNWEGDWAIRAAFDPKRDASEEQLNNMADWLIARQAGVDQARREVHTSGVRVLNAAEVNLVLESHRTGRPAMVNKVLPRVRLDLVSYSAYEGQEDPKLLVEGLDFIASQMKGASRSGPKKVYIGEFGYPENEKSQELLRQQLTNTVMAAKNWGCPYVVYWQLYCNEFRVAQHKNNADYRGYWLLRPDGTKSTAYETLSAMLRGH